MRSDYMDVPTRSIISLDQAQYAPDWTVVRVSVLWPHRHKGFGSMLLKRVCEDADREEITLWLHVQSDWPSIGVYDLTRRDLTAWYSRYGFAVVSTTFGGAPVAGIMRREPQ